MNGVFSPAWNSTINIANSLTSTSAVALPKNANAIALTNTSTTARAHVVLTTYQSEGAALPTGTDPTLTTGLPIMPGQQVIVHCGTGLNVIRTIATAADGALIVTPGNIF